MRKLEFRWDYASDPALLAGFHRFVRKIFDFDLALWRSTGFWDPRYVPFSLFHGKRVISNVCVYSMDLVISGKATRVAQISTCGTLPAFRRQGHAGDLLRRAMDWSSRDHAFTYLFASREAFPLYRSHGFRPVKEHKICVDYPRTPPRPGMMKIDPGRADHRRDLVRRARDRGPVSFRLGTLSEKLFMYHCLYRHREDVHLIPDLDVVVMFRRQGRRLIVYDVVGEDVPPFGSIYPYISTGRKETVEFRFPADRMRLGRRYLREHRGENTHVLGAYPFSRSRIIFPETARA